MLKAHYIWASSYLFHSFMFDYALMPKWCIKALRFLVALSEQNRLHGPSLRGDGGT